MVFGAGQHHAVHQHARNLHLARIERAPFGDALHLDDHEAAAVVRGHGDRQRFQRQRFALHGDIAVGIGGGAAHDGDVDREGLVEQILLIPDAHQLDQILGGALIQLAAAKARIDEGA